MGWVIRLAYNRQIAAFVPKRTEERPKYPFDHTCESRAGSFASHAQPAWKSRARRAICTFMSTTYPYTLDVQPSERTPGTFEWTIRRHGKLIQRSDRVQRTEADARKDGEKAIERQFADAQSTR